jgi:prepilin-type N-terminal cleavage/methylation domain-containing protein
MKSPNKHLGFTLVEMLVVIMIIGILVGLMLPVINMAREKARQTQCANNQSELGKAIISYELSKQKLPGVLNRVEPTNLQSWQTSWIMAIFGELGRNDLLNAWRNGVQPGYSNLNDSTRMNSGMPLPVLVEQLICPSNKQIAQAGGLSYIVNMGVYQRGANSPSADYSVRLFRNRASIANGATNPEPDFSSVALKSPTRTVMLSESLKAGPWYNIPLSPGIPGGEFPPNATYGYTPVQGILAFAWPVQLATTDSLATVGLSSNHHGVVIVTFCDGHTETLATETKCWKSPTDTDTTPLISGVP